MPPYISFFLNFENRIYSAALVEILIVAVLSSFDVAIAMVVDTKIFLTDLFELFAAFLWEQHLYKF